MKKLSTIILALALMGNTACSADSSTAASSQVTTSEHVKWFTDYSDAAKLADSKGVPLVLFFTGSDWCMWCTKLEQEALDKPEFAHLAANKFVFVKLDFPMRQTINPQLASQNDQLKKKYGITGFPSVIIADANGNRIGATGYRPGGPKAYAEHLLSMSNSYVKHQSTLQTLRSDDKQSFENLKQLYVEARDAGKTQEAATLLQQGLAADKENFFQLEQYRAQIANGNLNSKEAILHRDKLLRSSSDNVQKATRDVAVVEFQVLQQKMKQQKLPAAEAISPLLQYVEAYGAQDPEIWRVKMTISQAYLEGGQSEEALRYAKEAQQSAPKDVKGDIDKAIQFIRAKGKA